MPAYTKSPIGRSLWRKKVKDGDRRGVKAKTIYPARPEEWQEEIWPSDMAWSLVKSGLMGGKSIGFLTLKSHQPMEGEIRKKPALANVSRIIDEWVLLEYCCCWLPVNPEATVEAVSKSLVTAGALKFVGQELPTPKPQLPPVIPFMPLEQVGKAIRARLATVDVASMMQRALHDVCDKIHGRI